jgi:PAS domain S-box-containing protein
VLLMRVLAEPWMGPRPFLLIFLLPVILAAYMGGLRPGLLATVLSGVSIKLFVFPPLGRIWFADPLDFAHWLLLLLIGVLISVLFDELQQWRDKTAARSTERRHAATELKVRVGFAIAMAFLGVIGIVSFLSVSRLSESAHLVAHSQLVISNIDALIATAFENESAQRAYLLTGEEPFAADYTRATGRVDGLVQQLRDAVSKEPAQLARVGPLAEAIRARMQRSSELIELRRSGGLAAVQQTLAQSSRRPGASLQTRIRTLAQEMKVAEIELLNERELAARSNSRVTQAVIVGGSGFALIFVSLALYTIRRDFAGRTRAESELNRFFDLSIDLFVIATPDGRFKRMSPAVKDILGYTIEEGLALDYMKMQHPDDLARTHEVVDRQIVHGERVENYESRFRHKDGSYRMLSWRSKPQDGLLYATARDVTDAAAAAETLRSAKEQLELRVAERTRELAQANESLRTSERRFRALIEHGSDCIAMIGRDSRIVYLSPAVANVEGYQPEELIGSLGTDNTHPDDLPVVGAAVEKVLEEPGKPISLVWSAATRTAAGSGSRVSHQHAGRPFGGRHRHQLPRHHRALDNESRLGEQMQRLALMSRITRGIGERQDLRSIFQVCWAALKTNCRWISARSACTTWARTGSPSIASATLGARGRPVST